MGAILSPNRSELADLISSLPSSEQLEGTSPAAAAAALCAISGAPVVVTLGADGALLHSPGGGTETFPARRAEVRDTTGAGDTFNGVMAARLSAGDPLPDAVRTATLAASLSVERVGARTGMPSPADLAAVTAAAGTG